MKTSVRTEAGPILVVEDELVLAEAVKYSLEREGYEVLVALDGQQVLEHLRVAEPALVLLDLMLPGISGLDLCRMIRANSIVPIVMLTAKDSESDKVVSLEMGADDYVTKPFSMQELISRVRAHLRRSSMLRSVSAPASLKAGPVEMDPASHGVWIRGEEVTLPPKEFALLELFLARSGKLLTRDLLISKIWGNDYFGDTRTLDVHVKRLRSRIEQDPHRPRHLMTIRGLGYKFEP
ncbi:MAG: response regulator [Actinomycetota bacterium]